MKDYNIRTDLTGDIVSGLTVGIMHIPQGEAVSGESYLWLFLLNWDLDKDVTLIL